MFLPNKIPVQSQEYNRSFPFVWCVRAFDCTIRFVLSLKLGYLLFYFSLQKRKRINFLIIFNDFIIAF